MRELFPSTLLLGAALSLFACTGSSDSLPSGDGYGPLSNGSQGSPAPTSAPTSTSPPAPTSPPGTPTSSPPPSSPPAVEAGTGDWDAGGGWAPEAGTYDAGGWGDAGTVGPEGGGVPSTLLSLCVGEINEVRNQNGAFPYAESSQLEAYAALAAASDAQSGQAHGYFYQTNGGGVATTEDEFNGDDVDPGGTAQQVLNQGLLDDEQNGGGGFDNLVTNQLSQVGCGFAQDAAGNWWVTIAFQ
jgi:hypothetical protein